MIRVLIERHIAECLESAYEQQSRKVLQHSVAQPGFISGETLVDKHDPHHRITLSNWRSEADWQRWFKSRERRELMAPLIPMMDKEEIVTVLEQYVA
ncbi:MAG: antibiotic biosynthesis monooxygenase [Alteromonadaceae bacterium]|nr:antibiotic biosynthesis monooxygenase [Alteromonadaceae bacterium]